MAILVSIFSKITLQYETLYNIILICHPFRAFENFALTIVNRDLLKQLQNKINILYVEVI